MIPDTQSEGSDCMYSSIHVYIIVYFCTLASQWLSLINDRANGKYFQSRYEWTSDWYRQTANYPKSFVQLSNKWPKFPAWKWQYFIYILQEVLMVKNRNWEWHRRVDEWCSGTSDISIHTHSGLIWTEYKLYAYTLAMFSFYWFLLESLLKLFVASNRFILSAFVCKLKCSLNKVGTRGDGCIHTNGIVERGTWWKCFVVLFRQAISPQLR